MRQSVRARLQARGLPLALVPLAACGGTPNTPSADTETSTSHSSATASEGHETSNTAPEPSGETSEPSATGDTGDSSADCEYPAWPNDIRLLLNLAIPLTFEAERMDVHADAGLAFVCGRGGVASVSIADGGPTDSQFVAWPALDDGATCKAIVVHGDDVIVLSSTATVASFGTDDQDRFVLRSELVLASDQPGRTTRAFDEAAYDLAVDGTTAWVSLGVNGIARLSIDSGQLASTDTWTHPEVLGTRGIEVLAAQQLVVANDIGTVQRLSMTGELLQRIERERPGGATRIISDGDRRVAVLAGGKGFEVFELVDDVLETRGRIVPIGTTTDLRFLDDTVLVSTGSELIRLRFATHPETGAPRLEFVSAEPRPGYATNAGEWFRALSRRGDPLALTENRLIPFELGTAAPAPNLWFERGTYSTFTRPDLPMSTVVLVFRNRGEAPMVLGSPIVDAPYAVTIAESLTPRPDCKGQFVLEPGERSYATVTFEPQEPGLVTEYLRLRSDDPNWAKAVPVRIEGNRPEHEIGSKATDVPMLTQRGSRFSLANHHGSYVLMKVFNTE